MATIAIRRTLLNIFDCIRCFFLRGIETSTWLPLAFHTTGRRYGAFPAKGFIEDQAKDWTVVKMQTKTAKMLLNITQTVQEMQQRATVALITASLTTPVGSIVLKAPTMSKTAMDNQTKETTKCASLPEISCSFIDSTPTYCYFIINSANNGIKKSIARVCGARNLRKMKIDTDLGADSDANNNSSFNEDDDNDDDDDDCDVVTTPTIEFSSLMLPRQRTFSESSDDNFICFAHDDDLDCKASSGSSKNYGYYSNQYDSETDYSSDDSCDEDEEEDEDCVMPIEKKVRFDPKPTVHVMRAWNYAYRSARKGDWENAARDRVRFQNRVQRAAVYLNPILEKEHRQKIYETRFAPGTESSHAPEPNTLDKTF